MLRSTLAHSAPLVSTIVAVLYTKERKGWAWAAGAGIAAHWASRWLTQQILHGVEARFPLPQAPVELQGDTVQVPEGKNPADFDNGGAPSEVPEVAADGPTGQLQVYDRNNNVIQLPTAMGEP